MLRRRLFVTNGEDKLELWRPDLLERVPSIVMLLGLGSLYFALGHIKLARGDA